MELNIKLEAYRERADYLPLGVAECRIGIDSHSWSTDYRLRDLFRDLCEILAAQLKDANVKAE